MSPTDPETLEGDQLAWNDFAPGDLVDVVFVVGRVFPEYGTVQLLRLGPVQGHPLAGDSGFMVRMGAYGVDCFWRAAGFEVGVLPATLLRLREVPDAGSN